MTVDVNTIECPYCHTEMPASVRFCPGCNRPRTSTQQELLALAHEMQRDYEEILAAAQNAEQLPADTFERLDQYLRISFELLPPEELQAVYDLRGMGTGFVGFTNLRLIIRDDGRVIHNGAMVSIPYRQISFVAHGLKGVGATIIFQTVGGRTIEIDFLNRAAVTAAHRIILSHILG